MSVLYILIIFLVFYSVQAVLYSKRWNKSLFVSLNFKDAEIFEGEKTELVETIINKKLIPVWWMSVSYAVSRYLIFSSEEDLKSRTKEIVRRNFYTLLSYEKLMVTHEITALKRGIYNFSELSIQSGDLFSRFKFTENKKENIRLCVYPRIIEQPEVRLLLNKLSGDILTRRHIIEDPFTFKGIREYYPYDSLKLVNWSATAKTGELKVNQYDYTITQNTLVLLNGDSFNDWDKEVLLEESIRLAATICGSLIDEGMQIGLLSNGMNTEAGVEINIAGKSGRAQMALIFEALAGFDNKDIRRNMSELLSEEESRIRKAQSVIFISYYYDSVLAQKYRNLLGKGIHVYWILPKLKDEELKIDQGNNLLFWEVSENERRIY